MSLTDENKDLFNKLKGQLSIIDPVNFVQNYLTLEGKPFRLIGNGFKPFCDIYRYIGIKALEPDSKPIILLKSRQIGGTIMACALEMYFMGSGLFGIGDKPPIRIIHAFPLLELAAAYSKTKLNQMISASIRDESLPNKKGGNPKSFMQKLLDPSSPTNDSLHFKQFVGGNHLWVESTGVDADRLMGRMLSLDTDIPTPNGFVKLIDLKEGDELFDEKGNICHITKLHPINLKPESYRITFDDGTTVDACADHLWLTQTKKEIDLKSNGLVRNTKEIFKTIGDVHSILLSDCINYISINTIVPIKSIPMRCITVDSESKLFLITKKFIPTHNSADIIFFDEIQRISNLAIGNALKILSTAKYGKPGKGVQIYFGTPRKKGSDFYKMWTSSSQQYYYLGCEKCEKHFPLYTPGSDEWEKIWLYDYIVKCSHCGFEQDKRQAAERGKWVALKDHHDPDCKMIGFHINQLYFPTFKRQDIENEKPGKHPINTERIYQTEVLGEFYQGDTSPLTPEDIAENCADVGRKFSARIEPGQDQLIVLGLDYGLRSDIEQLATPDKVKIAGQSYSTAIVLAAKGPNLLSIEFATKFKRNDLESKKGIIDQIMRQYSIQLAVGDIGFSQDLSETLHTIYGDRYLVSRARGKVNNYISFQKDSFPKEIDFERDHYIEELIGQIKKGQIKFPFGDYEKIAWLIDHCTSMEMKPSISKTGLDPTIHYVKGSTPNDGFCALLNAYIAYKFLVTNGFSNNNPLLFGQSFKDANKPLIMTGYISRRI